MPRRWSRPESQAQADRVLAQPIRGANANIGANDAGSSPRDLALLLNSTQGGSPLARAGYVYFRPLYCLLFPNYNHHVSLLQPMSCMSSPTKNLRPRNISVPHAQQAIRDNTMQLSSLSLRSPLASYASDSFIFPTAAGAGDQASIAPSISSAATTDSATDLTASTSSAGTTTPRGRLLRDAAAAEPSGLSLLLAQQSQQLPPQESEDSLATPTADRPYKIPTQIIVTDSTPTVVQHVAVDQFSERTPLLDVEAAQPSYSSAGVDMGNNLPVSKKDYKGVVYRWKGYSPSVALGGVLSSAVRALPAVVLGTLLNILDGISCT